MAAIRVVTAFRNESHGLKAQSKLALDMHHSNGRRNCAHRIVLEVSFEENRRKRCTRKLKYLCNF